MICPIKMQLRFISVHSCSYFVSLLMQVCVLVRPFFYPSSQPSLSFRKALSISSLLTSSFATICFQTPFPGESHHRVGTAIRDSKANHERRSPTRLRSGSEGSSKEAEEIHLRQVLQEAKGDRALPQYSQEGGLKKLLNNQMRCLLRWHGEILDIRFDS